VTGLCGSLDWFYVGVRCLYDRVCLWFSICFLYEVWWFWYLVYFCEVVVWEFQSHVLDYDICVVFGSKLACGFKLSCRFLVCFVCLWDVGFAGFRLLFFVCRFVGFYSIRFRDLKRNWMPWLQERGNAFLFLDLLQMRLEDYFWIGTFFGLIN